MKKVLWFSRHAMTPEQVAALGDVTVTQVNGNLVNVHAPFQGEQDGVATEFPAFKTLLQDFDVVAIVLPINLEAQVLSVAGVRPVIRAVNERVLVPNPDGGEDKVQFVFAGWKRLVKIDVVLEDYPPETWRDFIPE